MNILIEIVLISLACMGLFTISHDGMVLEPLRLWIDSKLPAKGFFRGLYMPVIGCPICYASVWGTILHFRLSELTDVPLGISVTYWIPVCLSVAFLNSILLSIKYNLEK